MKKPPATHFGVTSMSEKGQVVIPADIRAALKFKKGEKLIVMAHGHGVTLSPAREFAKVAERLTAIGKLADLGK